jgi:arylsulfatase A-like enzyme
MSRFTSNKRRPLIGAVSILALALAAGACGSGGSGGNGPERTTIPPPPPLSKRPNAGPDAPNFVFVLTDDQAQITFRRSVMPKTFDFLVDHGTYFPESLSAPPLCCPYRAGFITGQYPHNHGVFSNRPGYADLRDPGNVLPEWMRTAGYRTAIVGKYLNGTQDALGLKPPPGWDESYITEGYRDTVTVANGTRVATPGYGTNVITKLSLDFLRRAGGKRKPPFFLWVAEHAPHSGRSITPSCANKRPQPSPSGLKHFKGPSFEQVKPLGFNEANVSDKPRSERLPRLAGKDLRDVAENWRCAGAALYSVDHGIHRMEKTLRKAGELDNTVFVFSSDNGWFFGEHRIKQGKAKIYDPAFRVPLAMRVPPGVLGRRAPAEIPDEVAQIDLGPTMLDLAGADPCTRSGSCRRMDGRSLRGLLERQRGDFPRDRAILMEVDGVRGDPCRHVGLRTSRYAYARTESNICAPETELYDLRADPGELENLAGSRPALEARLEKRLDSLLRCSGVEGRDPPIKGTPFCD